MKIVINETEKRVLQNIHLKGCTGSMGAMKLQDRRKLINGLIEKKLLNNNAQLTLIGIEISSPFSNNTYTL